MNQAEIRLVTGRFREETGAISAFGVFDVTHLDSIVVDPTLPIIVLAGPSGVGKTVILNALRACLMGDFSVVPERQKERYVDAGVSGGFGLSRQEEGALPFLRFSGAA